MNLNTITEVRRVSGKGDEDLDWREGDGWLAGGTWLFSEPQPHLRRLIDLHGFEWEPLVVGEGGLQISPACTIAQLAILQAPLEWTAASLIQQCCRSFLASFKVWNTATVGGNICMSLPAGPMISLTVALEDVFAIRLRDGGAKGMGECPINPVSSALANALADATGVRFRELPFTPDRIYRPIFERHAL